MSLGCEGKFSFELDIISRTKCSVHIFDCNGDWEVPTNVSSRVFPHKLCVGPQELSEGDPIFMPYEDLVSKATSDPSTPPIYLSIDLGGYEFQMLPALLTIPLAIRPVQIGFMLDLSPMLFLFMLSSQPKSCGASGNKILAQSKMNQSWLFYFTN